MATVNRFSKPLQSQLINPLSLQDALVVPSFMRQQHNALSSVAAENAVLDSDSLGQDRELVQQLLSPIEQGYNDAAKTLAKNGFSQQRADEFLDLQGKKQRVEKDYLTNIAGRKQSVMAERERLAGLYDDEDTRASTLARFDLENSGKMTIDEDGKLQSPGLRTPRTYEIMSDKDMADLQLSAVSKLKAMVTSLGKGYKVDNITNMDQFSQAITDQKITELSPQRIQAVLQSVMGKETLDSYKQQGINRGLGWDQGATERYQTSYLQQKEAQLKQMQSAEKSNLKDGEKAQYTDNFIASQMDVLKQNVMNSDASELYARDQLNNNINNMSNAMAYREEDFDTKILSRPFQLYMAKKSLENDGIEIIPLKFASPFKTQTPTDKAELNEGMFTFGQDGNMVKNLNFESKFVLGNIQGEDVYYTDKEGDIVTSQEIKDAQSSFSPQRMLTEGYKMHKYTKNTIKERVAEASKELNKIRTHVDGAENLSDQDLLQRFNEYKDKIDAEVISSYQYYNKDKNLLARANQNILGLDDNSKYTNTGMIKGKGIILDNGKNTDFKSTMEDLGFEIKNEASFREFAEQVKPRIVAYIPQLGKYQIQMEDSDGNPRNALVSPVNENLKAQSIVSSKLYEFSKSGNTVEVIKGLPIPDKFIAVAINDFGAMTHGGNSNIGIVTFEKEELDNFQINWKKDMSGLSPSYLRSLVENGVGTYSSMEEINQDALTKSSQVIAK